MRSRGIAIALWLLAAAGCGGDEEKKGALRVDVVIASADGEPPTEGWKLQSESGALLSCVIESKGPGHVVISANGPAGRYGIKTPPGFGIVDLGPKPLEPGLPPVTAFLGRERTLYLTPRSSSWRAIDAIVVPHGGGSLTKNALKTTREAGADGRLAIRIDAEAWKKEVVLVTALLVPPDGEVAEHDPRGRVVRAGRFSTVLGIKLPQDGTPTGVIVEPDSPLPFLVHLVHAPTGEPLAGRSVQTMVSLGQGNDLYKWLLVEHLAVTGADGIARFDALPGGSPEMRAYVLSSGVGGDVDPFREAGEARFLVSEGNPAEWGGGVMEFDGAPSTHDDRLALFEVRPLSGRSYGRSGIGVMSSRPSDTGVTWDLPYGTYSAFVRFGDRVALLPAIRVAKEGVVSPRIRLEALCTIQGSIVGSMGMGRPLDVFARRMEDGKPVEAEGWVLRRLVRPEFSLMLPTGDSRITAEDAAGKAGPVTELSLEKPGTRANLKITAP